MYIILVENVKSCSQIALANERVPATVFELGVVCVEAASLKDDTSLTITCLLRPYPEAPHCSTRQESSFPPLLNNSIDIGTGHQAYTPLPPGKDNSGLGRVYIQEFQQPVLNCPILYSDHMTGTLP
jgi:hypothetical protein